MTDGVFKTWESAALGLGVALCMIYGFISGLGDAGSVKPFLISFMMMSAALFAKPVWLLGNWKEIRTWERTTAQICEKYYTQHSRGFVHRHLEIEFTSDKGRIFHRTIMNTPFMFKKGQNRDIMFKEEYIDVLIFVPQAFRQAIVSAVLGTLLEAAGVVSMILL